MSHSLSQGFPFDWKGIGGQLVLQTPSEEDTLFQPLDIDLPELPGDDASNPFKADFSLGVTSEKNGGDAHSSDPESRPSSKSTQGQTSAPDATDDQHLDLWQDHDENDQTQPGQKFYTWEALEKTRYANTEFHGFLSEAGPQVFDAALSDAYGHQSPGALPQDHTVSALMNLSIGRSSLFFQWNAKKACFVRTLEQAPISGLSWESSDSLIQNFSDGGTRYRRLVDFAEATGSREASCPAVVALKRCVAEILDSIEGLVTKSRAGTRSLLQLQMLMRMPFQLLEILLDFVTAVNTSVTDEEAISALADHVHSLAYAGHPLCGILDRVLARSSVPWIERLSNDLGLRAETPGNDWLAGQRDLPTDSITDDAADEDTWPSFVKPEDRQMVREVRHGIRILRSHFPGDIRTNLLKPVLLSKQRVHRHRRTESVTHDQIVADNTIAENLVWADHDSRDAYITDLDARISRQPHLSTRDHDQRSDFDAAFSELIDGNSNPPTPSISRDFDPLENLRPHLRHQHRLVNTTILRRLFNDLNLRNHFDLQHQFHLFGNGTFVTRLSIALFSAEAQSAERKRGNLPTTETMGLRLGAQAGQRWPPASSELRLTLMGVLNETYRNPNPKPQAESKDLPGGLSFSIRELPEEEIEKVMDAESIYALDFLRLSYTAPAPLDAILTPASMGTYDSIFRFVLKILRVLHVTTRLRERILLPQRHQTPTSPLPTNNKADPMIRFSLEAHHFTTTLMSYTMETAISIPWARFTCTLACIENDLQKEDPIPPQSHRRHRHRSSNPSHPLETVTPIAILEMHESTLSQIRTRLFLRKRSVKSHAAIEDVLGAILAVAAHAQMHWEKQEEEEEEEEEEGEEMRVEWDSLISRFRVAVKALLRGLESKTELSTSRLAFSVIGEGGEGGDEGAWEAWRGLGARLDFNGFYSSSDG